MIFAITNQKGGVGKTTSVLNIGVYLATMGKKVLLVDADPQANLSSGLGIASSLNESVASIDITPGSKYQNDNVKEKKTLDEFNVKKYKTTYDLLINKTPAEEVIQQTKINNLSIIPSGIELAGAEVELVSALSRENILKKALKSVSHIYDYIIIDCPPSLGLLTINSLVSADYILIPVQAEYFALEGLGQLINTIKLIKSNLNQNMDIGGVILTMYDNRTNLSKDVAQEIEKYFEEKLFKTLIPRNIKLSEAPSYGLSIYEYAPQSSGGIAYESLTQEIIERFEAKMIRPLLSKGT